jgi:hypothetical protein
MALDHVDQFIADLRASAIYAPIADDMADMLTELDLEGESNPDAAKAYAAFSWILRQPRTADEKLRVIDRLILLPKGKTEIASMRQFAGWHDG